ncbi:zinc finger protein 112 isoform X2 [Gadus morhua]|uniref:zinc finger protein 112 isoform X2 n=1 Tax=Gadus morhua TaxID=8049 RepID=UPI0011B78C3A|nr:zinc finger protein 112-like isoform X2 [Gadus morhua]
MRSERAQKRACQAEEREKTVMTFKTAAHSAAPPQSLYVDALGSSHMASHSEELRILGVYGKGEGPMALDGHDTLFKASEMEALNSLSADHSKTTGLELGDRLFRREELSVQQQTPDTISIKVEEDIDGGMPAVEDCDDFRDRSPQCGATSESLHVDALGSSRMASHNGELRILSVYGKGEGPLALDGHNTLFTASEVEALNSLSAEHSKATGLELGDRLVRREELSVQQQTPDTISIKVEEDIDGRMPAVGGDEALPSQQDPLTLDQGKEDCNDIRDRSTQCGAPSESLHVDAPGSSHMSSHNGELHILSVYGKGEGPLAVDGHDTLFTTSKLEASCSLSADHSVAKSLKRGERLVRREEPSVQQTPDTISIKVEEDIGGGMPTVEDGDDFGARSTQRGATSEGLHVDAPASHMSSPNGELTGHRGGRKGQPCDLFGKGFPDNTKMTIHMGTHTSKKPYGCDQCMKRFQSKGYLKIHMRTHSGEKPYRCDQCLKRFGQKGNLDIHMRTHSGEKPYRCDQCMKRFGHSSSLKTHMRTHSGEKPFSCDQCVKRFSQRSNLTLHMKIHSGEKPYSCDQCMKRYSQSTNLKLHMMSHSGEKPYRCDQCMKCFSQNINLKIHMRTHSREKPCLCLQCDASFSDPSNLRVHMLKHTGKGVI